MAVTNTMDEENKVVDQDGQNHNGGEGGQSDDKGDGGKGDDTPKVKIGDKEYTTDELAQIVDKGSKYDDLLPDYTKKSQRLAEIEKGDKPEKGQGKSETDDDTPYFLKPDWKPETMDDLRKALGDSIEFSQKKMSASLESQKKSEENQRQAITDFFDVIKKSNKDFDESDFSSYVLKHSEGKEDVSLDDLKVFYSTYKDFLEVRKLGKTDDDKGSDKVNIPGGGKGSPADFSDLRNPNISIDDAARQALNRIKN